jgi:hypothetical protein
MRECVEISMPEKGEKERERNIYNTEGSLPTEVRAIGVSLSLSISGAVLTPSYLFSRLCAHEATVISNENKSK